MLAFPSRYGAFPNLPQANLNIHKFLISFWIKHNYVPGVDSASNRNEYHESCWGVKDSRGV
jgi:hypothetical protein